MNKRIIAYLHEVSWWQSQCTSWSWQHKALRIWHERWLCRSRHLHREKELNMSIILPPPPNKLKLTLVQRIDFNVGLHAWRQGTLRPLAGSPQPSEGSLALSEIFACFPSELAGQVRDKLAKLKRHVIILCWGINTIRFNLLVQVLSSQVCVCV